jgi:hypothetical protein
MAEISIFMVFIEYSRVKDIMKLCLLWLSAVATQVPVDPNRRKTQDAILVNPRDPSKSLEFIYLLGEHNP